ncbi:MAG TPA: bacillithiol system redox-active protein YtxJ [Longimicrobium sp.]
MPGLVRGGFAAADVDHREREPRDMKQIASRQDVDEALGQDGAILFKYSMTCPISANARREMESFLERRPDAPVFKLDVHEAPEASEYVSEKTGLEHESPQVIIVRGGKPDWHATHFDVTASALEEQIG